jgi:uncharacterized protein YceK
MKLTLISIAVLATLAGCASTPPIEATTQAHEDAQRQVAAADAATSATTNAPIILPVQDVPYLPRKSLPRGSYKAELPHVLRSMQLVHFATQQSVTARQFARLLVEEFKLPVKLEAESSSTAPPGQGFAMEARADLASLPPMPLRDFVTTVSRMLGTDWDWQDETLLIQPAFTRTYPVSTSPDTSEGKTRIGKQSSSAAGASGGSNGASGNFSNELVSGSEHKLDPWKDLEGSLGQIAGAKNVVLGKSFNVVTVTCSKTCHRIVKQFIDNVNHSLNQQVLFKVQEITVASSLTGESGVNWSLVYRTVLDSHRFRFALDTPASLVGSTAGAVQNILVPCDPANPVGVDGSSLIVQALSTASKFVDVKPYATIIANNETGTLTNIEQQSYTQSYTVVPATILGGQPVYIGNPGYATFGQILQVRPTILPDGNIKVTFALDDTSGKVNKGTGQGVIDSVLMNAVNVNTKLIVKPGSTLVLSSFKRTTHRSNNQGLLPGQKLGSETGTNDVTETVILVTPYIANVGAL